MGAALRRPRGDAAGRRGAARRAPRRVPRRADARTWRSTSRRSPARGSSRRSPGHAAAIGSLDRPDEITVLDVVEALEGCEPAFRCTEIRRRGPARVAAREYRVPCSIHVVMDRADAAWRGRAGRDVGRRAGRDGPGVGPAADAREGVELAAGGAAMKVFLTGATGAIGPTTVRALLDAGHDVRAVARTDEKADALRRAGAEPVDRGPLRRRPASGPPPRAATRSRTWPRTCPPRLAPVAAAPGRCTTGCAPTGPARSSARPATTASACS